MSTLWRLQRPPNPYRAGIRPQPSVVSASARGDRHASRRSARPAPAAQGATGPHLLRAQAILDGSLSLRDDVAAPLNESLEGAPEVLPLGIPSERPAGAWTGGASPGPTLGLAVWHKGRSVVVSVAGDVDIATTAQLSEALCAALSSGVMWLVCDLTGVAFLDASGLRALLIARRRAIVSCARLDLVCTQSQPRKVIRLTGLDALFTLHCNVAEAVDAQDRRGGCPGLAAAAGGG